MINKKLLITDTTLRDGEQSAGVVFSTEEKMNIAKLLDQVGVNEIEVGIPAMDEVEMRAIKKIKKLNLNARLIGWNRANIQDINKSIECGLDGIHVGFPVSDLHIEKRFGKDRKWVLENISEIVKYAKGKNLYVSTSGEDASRADPEFIIEFAKVIKNSGADRMRMSDTVGRFNPLQVYNLVKKILENVEIDIEIHTHNDFGMATANVIAAVEAGATHAQGTVMGIGERAGNGRLEEIIMALKNMEKHRDKLYVDTHKLKDLVHLVAKAANREVPSWKSIVGENIFAHESGIHVHAGLKANELFESFSPEDVGLDRKLVIGKHSGSKGLIHKFQQLGLTISEDQAYKILAEVRQNAINKKGPLTDAELLDLVKEKAET